MRLRFVVGAAAENAGPGRDKAAMCIVGGVRSGSGDVAARAMDGGASVGAVHAVTVCVAVRAMDGGASMMDFLLPSFSRRDNLVKYVKRMVSPQHTRHVEACRVLSRNNNQL